MKKFLIVLFSIISCVCICIDIVFFIFLFTQPDLKVNSSFNAGEMEDSTGVKRNFIEVLYYKNEDNSGLELFEIKFNYFTDESKSNYFSQGLQYVASDVDKEISFDVYSNLNYEKEDDLIKKVMWWNYYNRNEWCSFVCGSNTMRYDYQSADDFETTAGSTNSIDFDSSFLIELPNSGMFLMEFKNDEHRKDCELYKFVEDTSSEWNWFTSNFYDTTYYLADDYTKLVYLLFNAVSSMPAGTDNSKIFEFGNMFNYYQYDEESKTYSEVAVTGEDLIKVEDEVKSYFSIDVKVVSSGAKVSSDSMFGQIKGSSTFNLTGDYVEQDYLYGRQVISLNEEDFIVVDDEVNGSYTLKLSDDFIKFYYLYKDDIVLNIVIDLNNLDYSFDSVGVDEDSLGDFSVAELTIIDYVESEVA